MAKVPTNMFTKWLTGKELLSRWEIKDFELYHLIKEGDLSPYDVGGNQVEIGKSFVDLFGHAFGMEGWKSYGLPVGETHSRTIAMLSEFLFKEEDVLRIDSIMKRQRDSDPAGTEEGEWVTGTELMRREGTGAKAEQAPNPTPSGLLPCKPGTKWEDITITLVSNEMVRIKTPEGDALFTFHNLQMADGRRPEKPTVLWTLLRSFIRTSGRIASWTRELDEDLSKCLPSVAKRLNKHFKNVFGIDESIYRAPYKKGGEYVLRFLVHDKTERARNDRLDCSDKEGSEGDVQLVADKYKNRFGI